MINLDSIGFYTLTNERCEQASHLAPLQRAELILTDECNLNCPYCRGLPKYLKNPISLLKAIEILNQWIDNGLENIRFSGGEPLSSPILKDLISLSYNNDVERIAVSTNGTYPIKDYLNLIDLGVNDFSISLDACCQQDTKIMSGGKDIHNQVTKNIQFLSQLTYVTIGIVINENNINSTINIIKLAESLNVSDIRIIPSAQYSQSLSKLKHINNKLSQNYPILKYRINNTINNIPIRGLTINDNNQCPLVLDDIAVAQNYHFPCIIYLRENGNPIGTMNQKFRLQRKTWFENHNTYNDPICKNNCLDVCRDYNNLYKLLH